MKKALKHIKRILIVTAVVIAVVCAALFGCILYLRTFVSEPVRQDKDGKLYYMEYTGELTSLTQYSTVYHNNERSMDICIYPDYTEVYHFTLS